MQRRDFLATIAATGALSVLDPAYLAAKEALAEGIGAGPSTDAMVATTMNCPSSASVASRSWT